MASGYEMMDCGVTDPGLGWRGAKPTPVADAFLMAFALAGGALNLYGLYSGARYLLGL